MVENIVKELENRNEISIENEMEVEFLNKLWRNWYIDKIESGDVIYI